MKKTLNITALFLIMYLTPGLTVVNQSNKTAKIRISPDCLSIYEEEDQIVYGNSYRLMNQPPYGKNICTLIQLTSSSEPLMVLINITNTPDSILLINEANKQLVVRTIDSPIMKP